MTDFESIIAENYTDGEVTDTVAEVRDQIARDMEIVFWHDNARGYL